MTEIQGSKTIEKSQTIRWQGQQQIKIFLFKLQSHSMSLFKRKKRYAKISYEKRIRLIELVEEEKLFIYQAAHRLRIKLATAKVILKSYRKHGKILQKKIDSNLPSSSEELVESQSPQNAQEAQEKLENHQLTQNLNSLQFFVVCPFPGPMMF